MLVEELEGQFACSGKNTEQYIMFSVPIEKEVTRNDKKGKEITKTYLTDCQSLTVEDLRQALCQILLIILLK